MKKNHIYRLVLGLGLLLLAHPIWACECDLPLSPQAAADSADIIFEGQLVHQTTNWMSGGMKFTFAVRQYWKNRVDSVMVINSGFEQTDCGYAFQKDRVYLVYGQKKFSVKTDRCSGTKPIEEAALDLQLLGPGLVPGPSPYLPLVSGSVLWATILALVFMAVIVLRKRKTT